MQNLTILLGLTAICTVVVASPSECDSGKLDECRKKNKNDDPYGKLGSINQDPQLTLQDGKEMCREYATLRDCVGGVQNLQACLPSTVDVSLGTTDIEAMCGDEDTLKGWICAVQQSGHLEAGFQTVDQEGTTCEEANQYKSQTLAFLTGKCGEKIRGAIEKGLDYFIEQSRFCA